jgi:hypothetical protein
MLATTNPAALAEIDPTRDRRVPYQGQIVLFHARPGEGRGGRFVSPAIVMGIEDEDHIELLILYAADDAVNRWKIPRRTDQNPYNSWSFTEWDEKHYQPNETVPAEPQPDPKGHLTWRDVEDMYKVLLELRNQVATITKHDGSKKHHKVLDSRHD